MKKALVIALATVTAVTAIDPAAFAQGRGRGNGAYRDGYEAGYNDAYRDGYRAGFGDARANRRFDDTDYSYGYGYNYGPPPPPPPPPVAVDRDARWRARYAQTY